MSKKTYTVTVARTHFASEFFEVEAESEDEAEDLALDLAKDKPFAFWDTGNDPEWEITETECYEDEDDE